MTRTKSVNKKKVGIITGSGPEAGIDLWAKILKANKKSLEGKFRGDIDAPYIIIYSIPDLGRSMDLNKYEEEVRECLVDVVKKISTDVDLFCIACNTLHYYIQDIKGLTLKAEFVSIVDAVIKYVEQNKIKEIAILGSFYGMKINKWKIYSPLHEISDVKSPKDFEKVHELVYDIKRLGPGAPTIETRFKSILEQFDTKNILLACTELPLVKVDTPDINLIDSTDLLAKEIVRKILK
ncbi:aspartate/glutamate racemase family protein [Acidobacteriota bacterium]